MILIVILVVIILFMIFIPRHTTPTNLFPRVNFRQSHREPINK